MADFDRSNVPLDFKLCVICQEKSTANLVENPTSHQKLLEAMFALLLGPAVVVELST